MLPSNRIRVPQYATPHKACQFTNLRRQSPYPAGQGHLACFGLLRAGKRQPYQKLSIGSGHGGDSFVSGVFGHGLILAVARLTEYIEAPAVDVRHPIFRDSSAGVEAGFLGEVEIQA